jgi:electron transfer flavoprotein beta subunit
MRILVCIKQVPGTTAVQIDPDTGVLKREGVSSKLNPFDLTALEVAVRIKERLAGTSVSVLSMGPPQAEAIIREAFMMGADEGYLLSDRRFAGADVLATAYTLAQGIAAIGQFDLIICGKQTTDGDTAQVGPELAELLGVPHVTWVSQVESVTPQAIRVRQELQDLTQIARLPYPCLITVEKEAAQPRLPSFRRKLATAERQISVLTLDHLADPNPGRYGLTGSATQVERIFPPAVNDSQVLWTGKGEALADKLHQLLQEMRYVGGDH